MHACSWSFLRSGFGCAFCLFRKLGVVGLLRSKFLMFLFRCVASASIGTWVGGATSSATLSSYACMFRCLLMMSLMRMVNLIMLKSLVVDSVSGS